MIRTNRFNDNHHNTRCLHFGEVLMCLPKNVRERQEQQQPQHTHTHTRTNLKGKSTRHWILERTCIDTKWICFRIDNKRRKFAGQIERKKLARKRSERKTKRNYKKEIGKIIQSAPGYVYELGRVFVCLCVSVCVRVAKYFDGEKFNKRW